MTYEIIKNSESFSGFNVKDDIYLGVIPGLCCGWMFEFKNAEGKINYNSVSWYEGTPEEYCQTWLKHGEEALFYMERLCGWEPTGRVVFRGYGEEYWCNDPEIRDWCIREIDMNKYAEKYMIS